MNEEKNLPNAALGVVLIVILGAVLVFYAVTGSASAEEPVSEATPAPTHTPFIIIEEQHKKTISAEEVKSVLAPASDLITSRYYYTDVVGFEDVKDWFGTGIDNPFTKSKGFIIYDGIVSVGVDLNDVKLAVDNDRVMITVTLPKEKIMAHEVDNSTLRAEGTSESIFNNLNAEDYAKIVDNCQKDTEVKVMNNTEYMKQVRENTKSVIRSFLSANELTREYGVEFKDA